MPESRLIYAIRLEEELKALTAQKCFVTVTLEGVDLASGTEFVTEVNQPSKQKRPRINLLRSRFNDILKGLGSVDKVMSHLSGFKTRNSFKQVRTTCIYCTGCLMGYGCEICV